MAAIVQLTRPASSNRRGRVRQKVHVPAYASFSDASHSKMLDLYEVLNISESGLALHCSWPMEVNQTVELCLDLAEAGGQISGTARVVWFDATGRVGFAFPILTDASKRQLSDWLFLNALASAANAESLEAPSEDLQNSSPRQNYTDILSAASAVQKEAESLGPDLEAILALVASRSRSLLQASGAAVALEEGSEGKDTMICRASAGPSAPPVGANLHVGSGFSGECVRSGKLLRCDDTETDDRVDRQSCRALGIRSIIAAPLRVGEKEKIVGLLELFSAQPGAFGESDNAVLQRLAETLQGAVNRSADVHESSAPPQPPSPNSFPLSLGNVLFADPPENNAEKNLSGDQDQDKVGGIRLPRFYLHLLFLTAAIIFLALGYVAEPWIQGIQGKIRSRGRSEEHTVFASSKPPPEAAFSVPSATTNLAQLRELANRGDSAAENALGLLYAAGDEKQGIKRDESGAARWFIKAAEHGSVPAQSRLGSVYWGGRGVAKDDNQAYFWTVLARANGDSASHALAPFIATHLTLSQRKVIERQAEQWLEQHQFAPKSVAGR
jgi:TPR repeat protein/putative methionine-R-sulfoxide reductase with GAF domain